MKIMRKKLAALGIIAMGTAFQLGSCTVGDDGIINVFLDTLGLQGLKGELMQNNPFMQFFEQLHDMGGAG